MSLIGKLYSFLAGDNLLIPFKKKKKNYFRRLRTRQYAESLRLNDERKRNARFRQTSRFNCGVNCCHGKKLIS